MYSVAKSKSSVNIPSTSRESDFSISSVFTVQRKEGSRSAAPVWPRGLKGFYVSMNPRKMRELSKSFWNKKEKSRVSRDVGAAKLRVAPAEFVEYSHAKRRSCYPIGHVRILHGAITFAALKFSRPGLLFQRPTHVFIANLRQNFFQSRNFSPDKFIREVNAEIQLPYFPESEFSHIFFVTCEDGEVFIVCNYRHIVRCQHHVYFDGGAGAEFNRFRWPE